MIFDVAIPDGPRVKCRETENDKVVNTRYYKTKYENRSAYGE